MVMFIICAHCDEEVPQRDTVVLGPGHRVRGGCRQVVCADEPDCKMEEV